MLSANRLSPTRSSIASFTMPIGWNWTDRPCASSKPPRRCNPIRVRLKMTRCQAPARRSLKPQKENQDECPFDRGPPRWVNRDLPRAPPRRPWGTPRRARVPPVDYRDGPLHPFCILDQPPATVTSTLHPTDVFHMRSTLVGINWNGWSRSIGMTGRDQSEWVVEIAGMRTALSSLASKVYLEAQIVPLRCQHARIRHRRVRVHRSQHR